VAHGPRNRPPDFGSNLDRVWLLSESGLGFRSGGGCTIFRHTGYDSLVTCLAVTTLWDQRPWRCCSSFNTFSRMSFSAVDERHFRNLATEHGYNKELRVFFSVPPSP